jgi:hypothetical protein
MIRGAIAWNVVGLATTPAAEIFVQIAARSSMIRQHVELAITPRGTVLDLGRIRDGGLNEVDGCAAE